MYPPAGWQPDPHDPLFDRYWDGQQWTAHTRPKGASDPTQAFAPAGTSTSPHPDEPAKRRRRWPWITGAAAVVGVLAIGAFGDTSPEPDDTTTAVVTTTVVPSTTPAPTTTRSTTTARATTTTTTNVAVVPLVPQHVDETSTSASTPPLAPEPGYVPPSTTVPPSVTPEEPSYAPPETREVPTTYDAPATYDAPTSAYYGSCADARAAGAAPLYAGEPGYRPGLDRDKDGVACEN